MGEIVKVRKDLECIGDLREMDEALDYVLKKLIYYTTISTVDSSRNYVLFTTERIVRSTILEEEQIIGLAYFIADKLEEYGDVWKEVEIDPCKYIGNYINDEAKRILWVAGIVDYLKFFIKTEMQHIILGEGTLLSSPFKTVFSSRYKKKIREVEVLNGEFYDMIGEWNKYEDKTKELMRVVECVYNKYMAILKEYGKE